MKSFSLIWQPSSSSSTPLRRSRVKPIYIRRGAQWQRNPRVLTSAQQNLYEVLGVKRSASMKEIKSAFKRKALELHPDVNKAPDAAERFKEVRHAYQVLSNEKSRAQHDRRGFTSFWDDLGQSSGTRGASGYPFDPAYGLEDVFRDLGEVFSDLGKELRKPDSNIESLFEEMRNLGEEFVEFLEENAGITITEEYKPPSTATESKQSSTPQPPKKEMEIVDSIDEALNELKKKMGL